MFDLAVDDCRHLSVIFGYFNPYTTVTELPLKGVVDEIPVTFRIEYARFGSPATVRPGLILMTAGGAVIVLNSASIMSLEVSEISIGTCWAELGVGVDVGVWTGVMVDRSRRAYSSLLTLLSSFSLRPSTTCLAISFIDLTKFLSLSARANESPHVFPECALSIELSVGEASMNFGIEIV